MDTYGDIEFRSGKLLQNGKNFGIEVVSNITERNALTGVLDGTVIMTADDHALNIYNATAARWNKIRNFTVSEVISPSATPCQLYNSDVRAMFTDINIASPVFNLPQAVAGYEFTFYKTRTSTFYISANGTDKIDGFAKYKNITSEIFVSCTIKCVVAGKWIVIRKQGSNWLAAAS